jgi:hypothetical protein
VWPAAENKAPPAQTEKPTRMVAAELSLSPCVAHWSTVLNFFLMVSRYFRVDEEEGRNHQTQQKSQERNRVGFFSIASKENIIYLHLILS